MRIPCFTGGTLTSSAARVEAHRKCLPAGEPRGSASPYFQQLNRPGVDPDCFFGETCGLAGGWMLGGQFLRYGRQGPPAASVKIPQNDWLTAEVRSEIIWKSGPASGNPGWHARGLSCQFAQPGCVVRSSRLVLCSLRPTPRPRDSSIPTNRVAIPREAPARADRRRPCSAIRASGTQAPHSAAPAPAPLDNKDWVRSVSATPARPDAMRPTACKGRRDSWEQTTTPIISSAATRRVSRPM